MPEQQIVEIAKAIGARRASLILDEPTASLTDREVESLFQRDRGCCAAQGVGHHLHLAPAGGDRDDRRSRDRPARRPDHRARAAMADVDRAELIRLMVGREISAIFPEARRADRRRRCWSCATWRAARRRARCSLAVRAARFSGSRDWWARAARNWRRRSSDSRPPMAARSCLRGEPVSIGSPGRRDRAGHRLRAGGPAAARRGAGDADRGQREPGESARRSRRRGLIDVRASASWRSSYVGAAANQDAFALRRGRIALRRQSAEGRAGALAGDPAATC